MLGFPYSVVVPLFCKLASLAFQHVRPAEDLIRQVLAKSQRSTTPTWAYFADEPAMGYVIQYVTYQFSWEGNDDR